MGRSRSHRWCTGWVAGALCRGESDRSPSPVVRCGGVGGWVRTLCLLWRASSTDVMGPRAATDEGGRIAQILVVAWTLLYLDVLSGGGRMCDFFLETAGNFHFLCHGRRRIRDRHDGTVLLLSRVSPASRRTTGTHDVERLAPVPLRHGNPWQVNGSRHLNDGWFWLEGLSRMFTSFSRAVKRETWDCQVLFLRNLARFTFHLSRMTKIAH